MSARSLPGLPDLGCIGDRHPALRLLVVFGSRARGDAAATADWDLGYVAAPGFDEATLLGELVSALRTDRVDLVDLERANGLLRYRASRDGFPLFERSAGEFLRFWWDSVTFWCDAEPILRRGYGALLDGLVP